VLVACVGGGSNAIGLFHPFLDDESVRLVGLEAAGDGIDTLFHAATISKGRPGVLHGARSLMLQDEDGQTLESHSISAGLDYPGVGPEHAWLDEIGRAEYRGVTDAQAMDALRLLSRTEGHHPRHRRRPTLSTAPSSSAASSAPRRSSSSISPAGDKDMETAARYFGLLDAQAAERAAEQDAHPTAAEDAQS